MGLGLLIVLWPLISMMWAITWYQKRFALKRFSYSAGERALYEISVILNSILTFMIVIVTIIEVAKL